MTNEAAYKAFSLGIEPTSEEIAAAEADLKNNRVMPVRGMPKSGAGLARYSSRTFKARVQQLWIAAQAPATESAGYAALVGETQAQIEQANAKRAAAWARITEQAQAAMESGKVDSELLTRIASINSAAWWLRADTSEDQIKWSIVNACWFDVPRRAVLPADFYAAAQVTKRADDSTKAANTAKFLGLPALKGSEKQVAWAEKIRADFGLNCSDDQFTAVATRKAAESAKFWIDNRTNFENLAK